MPPSPLLATGSKLEISIESSIPKDILILAGVLIKAITEVTGVITLKSVCPVNLWVNKKSFNSIWESKSLPPIETKLPLSYLSVNLPRLSDVVEFSSASESQFSFSSINTSEPVI